MSDREMNFWGWGYADEAPSEDALREHAEFLKEELGFPERPILDPVEVEDVTLPSPAVDLPDHLAEFCTTDKRDRMYHTYGSSRMDYVKAFRGEFEKAPDVIAYPTDEEDIKDLLAWATEAKVAVIPYGGGSGLVGGTEGRVGEEYEGVISLDLQELNQVLEVDMESQRALIQGGTFGPDINDQLAEHGLHLRHYPQSYEFSTLGGWIATRSGGHYATRYTHIDDFTESARMVTPAGTFETQPVPASGAGPDPNRLILGSEGTLGVITRAWMRVESRPQYRSDASVHFDDLSDAVAATRRIVQARLYPANCRLHDRNETQLYGMTDLDAHLLVLGFESTDHSTEPDVERAVEICEEEGGTIAEGPIHYGPGFGQEKPETEKQTFGQAFMQGPYTGNYNVRLCIVGGTIETAVTWDRFHDFHDAITDALEEAIERVCGTGIITTRFTHVYHDGPAAYIRFFAPGDPGSEIEQHKEIKGAGMDVLSEFDLTTTHHHAIGRDHKKWYAEEIPENFGESLGAVKDVLDPAGIMNPGVLID